MNWTDYALTAWAIVAIALFSAWAKHPGLARPEMRWPCFWTILTWPYGVGYVICLIIKDVYLHAKKQAEAEKKLDEEISRIIEKDREDSLLLKPFRYCGANPTGEPLKGRIVYEEKARET